jgi:L-fuconolactonase
MAPTIDAHQHFWRLGRPFRYGWLDAPALSKIRRDYLSGMVTEADWKGWTVDDLRPYVRAALECFGPDRLMFGSDWPVRELAATYGQLKQALVEALGTISEAEREAIFGGTAARFYRLPV